MKTNSLLLPTLSLLLISGNAIAADAKKPNTIFLLADNWAGAT